MLEGLRSSTEEEPGKGRAQQGSASGTGYVDVVESAVQQGAAETNQWQRHFHFLNSVIKKNLTLWESTAFTQDTCTSLWTYARTPRLPDQSP